MEMKLYFVCQLNSYSWHDQIKRPTRDFWPAVPGSAGLLLRGSQMLPKKNNPIADGSNFDVQVCSSTSKHLGPANQKKFENYNGWTAAKQYESEKSSKSTINLCLLYEMG